MQVCDRLIDHPDAPVPPGATCGIVRAADGIALRWAMFRPAGPPRGTVLVLQGRAEFIERWFETVRDLQARGFVVVAFDWRGQGGSQRLLPDRRKGHVADFRKYGLDLDAILREVLPRTPAPRWLLAHSTGGLVAIEAAERLLPVFERAVLIAPFLGLGDFGLPAPVIRRLAGVLRALGMARSWIPGGGATAVHTKPFARNRLTSDPRRHALSADLSWRNPDLAIGSPTVGWVAGAFAAFDRAFAERALAAWRLPTLLVVCGADRVVSNRAIERFSISTRFTDHLVIPGARHELLHERDRYREPFWAAFDAFVPGGDAAAPVASTSSEEGEHPLVQPGIAGGDDPAAVDGAAAGPGGDDTAGPLDHRDQGDDVVGLEPGLDHRVDEAGGDHAIGVAVDPVAREPHP